jgi:hypothetical protein
MTGKTEHRTAAAVARPEILHITVGQPLDFKPEPG